MNTPIVSVCITAYNIEKYIKRAIDSVLIQSTNFDFEIVIGEDKSSDKTLQIINDYSLAYPNRLRIIENKTNLGMMSNFIKTIESCHGKYIAILDGDDFWIDKNKLQTQFEILEAHPRTMLCWHDSIIVNSFEEQFSSFSERFKGRDYSTSFDLFTVIKWKVLGATSSIFFRNVISPFPNWANSLYGTEALLFFRCKQVGELVYFPSSMSAYRVHDSSMESSFNRITKAKRNINEEKILSNVMFPMYQNHFYRKILWNTFYLSAIYFREFKILSTLKYSIQLLILLPKYLYFYFIFKK